MRRLARLTNEFLGKIASHAETAIRLRKSNQGRLRLTGTAIGIVVVIRVAVWMADRPQSLSLKELAKAPVCRVVGN